MDDPFGIRCTKVINVQDLGGLGWFNGLDGSAAQN